MAGVKGMKGGGGARPGSGRKRKPAAPTVAIVAAIDPADADKPKDDALKLLHDIAFGRIEVSPNQLRAAIAAVQYTHTKRHDGGKKEEVAEKAKQVASRFAQRAVPMKLVGS